MRISGAGKLVGRAIYDQALDEQQAVTAVERSLALHTLPSNPYGLGDTPDDGPSWSNIFKNVVTAVGVNAAAGLGTKIGGAPKTAPVTYVNQASVLPKWAPYGFAAAGAGILYLLLRRPKLVRVR